MDNWYIALRVETRRREEEMTAAQEYARLQEALHADPCHPSWHQVWARTLGIRLVAWGYRLQAHYALPVEETAFTPVPAQPAPCS